MAAGDVAYAAFAIGGWLLSAFPQQQGEKWTKFLDGVLHGLEQLGSEVD